MGEKPLFFMNPNEAIEPLQDVYFPPYITLAHLFNAPEGWAIRKRVLHQYQLQYVMNGVADYRIGDITYETKRGDLLFHRPGEEHDVTTRPGKPYACLSIVFHFGETVFPMEELLPKAHAMGNFIGTELEKKLSELVVSYKLPGLVNQFQSQSLLVDILLQLSLGLRERADSSSTPSQRNNHARMVLIRNYIVEKYRNNVQIGDLEKLSGLSRDYMIEQFKRTFGMTPIQYLIHVRVEKAKELALQGGLTVGEIAERVGYADVHTFGKMFKKKTGYSLSRFCASLFTVSSHKEQDNSLPW
ncbi:AraC family transcriptional regulator [Paenibacillus antri]|uniref:AraC family transcriptional regulator n=1 Tax=Paenibacillus antri TaxID=2582848 RepID=A0A5R9GCI6_9BACL|nr:AraC family transcriptional regulator [Paenibacillus antri]TLS52799.1 AraC family transcriptional regulator [Paenibacillus antri]